MVVFRHLYGRDHLDQVIATFGIILFLNSAVKVVWGAAPLSLPIPEALTGSVALGPGLLYPVWRLVIIGSGLAVALLLYVLVTHTRIGMLVRAGATNRDDGFRARRRHPPAVHRSCSASARCWRVSPAS